MTLPAPPEPAARLRRGRDRLALFAALALAGCSQPDVVVYCALDQVHSEDLIRRFEEESGLSVRVEFDTEATKTVGLVGRIREERGRPRCDVFWNNEIANTVALAEEGLLQPYESPSALDIPAEFRDPRHRWTGFAARARVFIVNTDLVDPSEVEGTRDLLDPKWAGKVGMARPLTGTTLTHMTALFHVMGEEAAREYLEEAKAANERGELDLTSGNATLMRKVREGALHWGWTDTDDYWVAKSDGYPVDVVYPDQAGDDPLGTMVIPNTVAIVAGAPNPEAARRFVDWVLRPETEAALAASRTMQIPVRPEVPRPAHVPRFGPDGLKAMEVDFQAVGEDLVQRQTWLQETFLD
jgi:iron(III) transport system substrate-binding protein